MKIYFIFILLISTINLVILKTKESAKNDRKLFLRWDREEKWKRHIDRERCKLISQRRISKKNARNAKIT